MAMAAITMMLTETPWITNLDPSTTSKTILHSTLDSLHYLWNSLDK
jgi:hypothetical protein